ncbi:MAG: hypothetical protein QM722_15090 [Piscinibacter sp.]
MEYKVVKVAVSAETLQGLKKADQYRQRYSNIWATREQWRHFVRSRRKELEAHGLIVELTSGLYVNEKPMDEALPRLLTMPTLGAADA